MAGNKFRNNRPEKKEGKEEEIDIERNSQIKLMKDCEILKKPKDDEKYRSNCSCKKGAVLKVEDIIKNKGSFYIKVEYRNDEGVNYWYIPYLDKEGNKNVGKYEEEKEAKKNNEKKTNPNLTTYGSIRLSEAVGGNEPLSQELINCLKNSIDLKDKISFYLTGSNIDENMNSFLNEFLPFNYLNIPNEKEYNKKLLTNFYLLTRELEKYCQKNNLPKTEEKNSFPESNKERGLLVYVRPFDFSAEILSDFLFDKLGICHVFIIYNDGKQDKPQIIESKNIGGKNKLFFGHPTEKDLKKARIIQSVKLSEENPTYDSLKNLLQNKYGKEKCIRGEYSYIGKNGGNCFDTVIEILNILGISDKLLKENPAIKIREHIKQIKEALRKSLESPIPPRYNF